MERKQRISTEMEEEIKGLKALQGNNWEIMEKQEREKTKKFIRTAGAVIAALLLLGMLAVFAYASNQDYENAMKQAKPWMNPVITKEEKKAGEWILKNTNGRETFVSDIFGGEFIMGTTLREATEGGDWAVVPDVVKKMGEIDEFYKTKDAKRANEIAKKYGAGYAIIPNRQVFAGFGWMFPEKEKMNRTEFFQKVYEDNGFEIYRVK